MKRKAKIWTTFENTVQVRLRSLITGLVVHFVLPLHAQMSFGQTEFKVAPDDR